MTKYSHNGNGCGADARPPAAKRLDARSVSLRREILAVLRAARRGHLASALSLVEILRCLYDGVLRYDPANPQWPDRDRCLLSKGHGALALYAILADKGLLPRELLSSFAGIDSPLSGLAVRTPELGVECSGGSLGHGLSLGVGMALACRMRGGPSRVYVIVGDGETQEGSIWEAALSASQHGLDNLCVIVDHNGQQSWGCLDEVVGMEPYAEKWAAFGFCVHEADGHDVDDLKRAFGNASGNGRPHAVICRTVKGRGIASVEGNLDWHHQSRVPLETIEALEKELEAAS